MTGSESASGGGTIHGEVLASARRHGAREFQRRRRGGEAHSYADVARDVERGARGLRALGLRPGDRVALVAENCPRWLHADLAVLAAGAIDVPRGVTAGEREVEAIARHSGARIAILENAAALRKYGPALAGIERMVLLEGDPPQGAIATRWEEVLAAGDAADDDRPLPAVSPDDVATLVYTSGTTGNPKGVTLLHRNVVADMQGLTDVLHVTPGDVFLSLLPTWHMYERTVEYFAASRGAVLAYTDLKSLRRDLVEERPHFMASVPRVWEKLHDGIVDALAKRPAAVRALAKASVRGSLAYTENLRALQRRTAESVDRAPNLLRHGPALALAPLHALARALVHRRVHALLGGRLRAAISGGAALPPYVDRFLDAAGIHVLVGYGLTETAPVVAVRRVERNVLGTIGVPLAGTECRIVDPVTGRVGPPDVPGVLHVRGPQVMRGYWEDPEATARVLDSEGWFDTGDLCRLTSRRDIVFCGRAKDTIVLAGGENVEPEPLEQAALASPLVDQIVVVGQDRKTLGALVWPDADAARAALGAAAVTPEAVLRAVRAELDARVGPRAGFRPWERLQQVALLPEPLSPEQGTMTATLKTRRVEVGRRYAGLIEGMYGGAGREPVRE